METVNIHDAKTRLSRLIDKAAKGEPFIIAKAGKPLVKVSSISAPDTNDCSRLGFLSGAFSVPEDFNEMGGSDIENLFEGIE